MRKIHALTALMLSAVLFAAGCSSAAASRLWTKAEVERWYGNGTGIVRFVGYRGSDAQQHHFIARLRYLDVPARFEGGTTVAR